GIAHARRKLADRSLANPIQPRPGEVAGISIFNHLEHTRAANPEDPRLDKLPVQARWNLLANNLFQECPMGVYIGKGVADTILMDNTYSDCTVPIKDAGVRTKESNAVIGRAFE
ncbi:MAG: hypothetical protein Q8O57_09055, partial [Kiritimatiellota bacterium]|nr:hypothetical protein [Kiritimatiellota bacterium]